VGLGQVPESVLVVGLVVLGGGEVVVLGAGLADRVVLPEVAVAALGRPDLRVNRRVVGSRRGVDRGLERREAPSLRFFAISAAG
jgi:hypothetical protein